MARLSRLFELVRDSDRGGKTRVRVHTFGAALLRLALMNKGTAFTIEERIALGLDGLLPPHVGSLEEQLSRVYGAYSREASPIAKYTYLRGLQERNEILFYALLAAHLEEMLPIVYTPTVGEAVQKFHSLYQNARGLSLSIENVGRAKSATRNCLLEDVRMIVATDSSAILGIGDQGYGGMAIAIGKLALYTVGGVSPYRSLPVGLDVGTDRKDLLASPSYLGVRHSRLDGEAYLAFMDKVVDALHERWPRAILQWEDLAKDAAFTVLERYRHKVASFNDDIQGTGAVALAGLLVACKTAGTRLSDERVIVYGAGAGGAGVALAIREGMKREGLTDDESRERVLVLDSKGLLVEGRAMEAYKAPLAQRKERVAREDWKSFDLLSTIRNAKATALLGLSGQAGTFTEEVVRAMLPNAARPIVFALSNPTSSCEAQPVDILAWTQGRARVATGSPFAPVRVGDKAIAIGQGNNAFVFPGLGFGAILAEASAITDGMVLEAAYALAEYTLEHHPSRPGAECLYPPVSALRDVALAVATRVLRRAFVDGVARTKKVDAEGAAEYVASKAWTPEYLPFEAAPP